MTGYPVMLNLTGKSVVVVGGGKIAARKIARLIEADAVVTVISPKVTLSIKHYVQDNQVRWLKQPYSLNTHLETLEESVQKVVDYLEQNGYISVATPAAGEAVL